MAAFAAAVGCHVAISNVLLAALLAAVVMLIVLRLVLLVADSAVAWFDQGPKGDVVVVGISTADRAVALIPDFLFELTSTLLTLLDAKGAWGSFQFSSFEPAISGAATVLTEDMLGLFFAKKFATSLTIFGFRLGWHEFLFPVAKS